MSKPVPTHTPIPALEKDSREKSNLAPQGEVHIDDPGTKYTPEGDNEGHPNIPPDTAGE